MEKIWFLLVPLLLVQCFMTCLAMTPTNLTTDEAALLVLKSHITFDPNNVLTSNWSTATSCCNWIGVSCGFRHQRVTALKLSNMGLTGTIPPHLGNLSFLASLDMGNNNLHGNLPQELAFLRRLKIMNLGYNSLGGELPSWFGFLRNLESLLLSNNSFSGVIPPEMGNLASLKILRISNNGLTGLIPSAIFNISSIEMIDFANNSLSGSLPEYMNAHLKLLFLSNNQLSGSIPNALWRQRDLEGLSLVHNQFGGSIPREIGNLTSIKELFLSYNNFIGKIPEEVGYLHSLEKFYIVENMLTGSIPPALFNISSLVEINLRNNSLSGSLPPDMCYHLPALKVLGIRNNKIMGSIPWVIENCTSLVSMDLSNNMLAGTIPQGLGNLHNLENIIMEFNGLSGSIPSKIFNISTLKIMTLSSNHLSGQLPPSIGLGLPNLSALYLWGNELSGIIPSSISNASKLTILSLNSNSFTGFIPNTLGNLRLLQRLNVQYNSLGSSTTELEFLTSLTNCQYLEVLGLSGNPLNGILPVSIGNFSTSFEQFFAGECNIKGTIPREIGNLSNLIILQLGRNNLTGPIPPTVGSLQKLQGLEFSENILQGSIPYDLCLLRRLVYLYLGHNELSGPILACISNLTSLGVLYLDSNIISSVIPSTLSSLTNIFDINFSTNSLSGSLPSDIGSLKMLRQLDLSKNQFSGDVPSSIESLQSLVNLSLAHNRLQGIIPPSFGNLISLESMDVSDNNLSGAIPKSLEKLKYLKNLNVSFNRLQGEIPDGGPFANLSAQSFMMNDKLCGAPRFLVSPCKTGTPKRSMKTVIIYGLPTIIIIILVMILYVLIRCLKRKVTIATDPEADLLHLALRRISHHELVQATDKFSESNLLGNGSYGSVYKGILSDGLIVAIKVFNLQMEGAFKSFDAECEVLGNIRHRNLIKIISSCSNNLDFKALVLEYMPNGSLEEWLYSHKYCLDILQRLNIMIDVASALEYLHHSCASPVLHCDLKPSNILIDEDMVAHVGDFGISKLLGEGESVAQTKTLATIGYMAPEYGSGGIVSTRNDVYGYGIVMLETFARKKHSDEMFTEDMSLKRWVGESLSHGVMGVTAANLLTKEDEHFTVKQDCILSVLELALHCCAELPEERLDIKDVLITLNNIRTKFQMGVVETQKGFGVGLKKEEL